MKPRLPALLAMIVLALGCARLLLVLGVNGVTPAAALPPSFLPATATPLPTPVFSATMAVQPSLRQVEVGETVSVTVALTISEGCSFPLHDLTLSQLGQAGAIFAHLSPPSPTVGPGVSNPFTYTLLAMTEGSVRFRGVAYGERYCSDFWNWTTVSGESTVVRVGPWPFVYWLPAIHAGSVSWTVPGGASIAARR